MEREYPVLGEIRELLLNARCADSHAGGSGATVFGVFGDERSARIAAEGLDRCSGWKAWVTGHSGIRRRPASVDKQKNDGLG